MHMNADSGKGLSLVELMIAVSILAVGIVAVGRCFISVAYATSTALNYIGALQCLQEKIDTIEEETVYHGKDIFTGQIHQEIELDSRAANIIVTSEPLDDSESLIEITAEVSWYEGGQKKDKILSTYLPARK
jgi:prepilin-type N-terminal cleavage/methylation domain-containing protein